MKEHEQENLLKIADEYRQAYEFLAASESLQSFKERVRGLMSPTPRDEVYREHSVTLYRYRRSAPATNKYPLMIVPSLVNKPAIMDLLKGESFIAALLKRGLDVFMLEWGLPTPGQKHYSLDFYINNYLARAVRRTMKTAGADGVSLAGYCLGGLLSLLYAACDGGHRVKSLLPMVAPVNFEDRGLLSWWARKEHFDVDKLVDTSGNITADFFAGSFPWLVPAGKLKQLRTLYKKHQDPEFLKSFFALDIWISENIPFPGQVYREIIKNGYQRNSLVKQRAWPLGSRTVYLSDVTMPVFALTAAFDHVSPVKSCTALGELLKDHPDCTVTAYQTGHLGIALGKDPRNKPTTLYWDDIAAWLSARDL